VCPGPPRFTAAAVRQALEAELPDLRPAVLKPRFHLGDPDPVAVPDRIGRSHSQGVILNAADRPEVVEACSAATGSPPCCTTIGAPACGTPASSSCGRRGALIGPIRSRPSSIHMITPFNAPEA